MNRLQIRKDFLCSLCHFTIEIWNLICQYDYHWECHPDNSFLIEKQIDLILTLHNNKILIGSHFKGVKIYDINDGTLVTHHTLEELLDIKITRHKTKEWVSLFHRDYITVWNGFEWVTKKHHHGNQYDVFQDTEYPHFLIYDVFGHLAILEWNAEKPIFILPNQESIQHVVMLPKKQCIILSEETETTNLKLFDLSSNTWTYYTLKGVFYHSYCVRNMTLYLYGFLHAEPIFVGFNFETNEMEYKELPVRCREPIIAVRNEEEYFVFSGSGVKVFHWDTNDIETVIEGISADNYQFCALPDGTNLCVKNNSIIQITNDTSSLWLIRDILYIIPLPDGRVACVVAWCGQRKLIVYS
jgi:hypothetical protein